MKAAVYVGKQRFEIQEIPTPEPEPGEILVKVSLCAICGTDVHAFQYDLAPPGAVLGHEFVGTVVQLGSKESSWKIGDKVVGGGGMPPPGKEPAVRVHPRFNYRTMGFTPGPSRGYAEYIIMEEWNPIPLPEEVPEEAAALTEPCAVAVHAIRNSGMKLGDTVGIIGGGPIGMLCLQVARAAGAKSVFLSEPASARAETAIKLGADAVFNPFKDDVIEGMVELTDGIGPDVVLDCAGFKNTLDQSFNIVKRSGKVVLVAVPWEPLPLAPADWMAREIEFKASWGSLPMDWHIALDLMASDKVSISTMVEGSGVVSLNNIQETFENLMKPSTQLQMVIQP